MSILVVVHRSDGNNRFGQCDSGQFVFGSVTMLSVRWLIFSDMPYIRQLLPGVGMVEEDFMALVRQRDTIGLVVVDPVTREHYGFAVYRLYHDRFEIVCMDGPIPGLDAIIQSLKNKLSCHRRRQVVVMVDEHDVNRQIYMAERGFYAVPAGESIRFDYTLQMDDYITL